MTIRLIGPVLCCGLLVLAATTNAFAQNSSVTSTKPTGPKKNQAGIVINLPWNPGDKRSKSPPSISAEDSTSRRGALWDAGSNDQRVKQPSASSSRHSLPCVHTVYGWMLKGTKIPCNVGGR